MKVVITGGKGQLGQDVALVFAARGDDVLAWGREDLDITDAALARNKIREARPDLIIHAAAYTQVDACEQNEDLAYTHNALGARNLAAAALTCDAALVYISTDYVFDGRQTRMYREEDPPHPLNVYGRTKLAGEQMVREILPKHYICRTSWLYGEYGPNFVRTIQRLASERNTLKVVSDQTGTPTWTKDLANQIYHLVQSGLYGTYHTSGQGECSWYEFAKEIIRLAGLQASVLPQSTEEAGRAAARPGYSVLDNYRLRLSGLDQMPPWKDSLRHFMAK